VIYGTGSREWQRKSVFRLGAVTKYDYSMTCAWRAAFPLLYCLSIKPHDISVTILRNSSRTAQLLPKIMEER